MFFSVAFVVAERTLFFATLGASILAAEAVWYFSWAAYHVVVNPQGKAATGRASLFRPSYVAQVHAVVWKASLKAVACVWCVWCVCSNIAAGCCTAIVLVLSCQTVVRSAEWTSEESTLLATVRSYPMNAMSLYGKAWGLYHKDWDMAEYYNHRSYLAAKECVARLLAQCVCVCVCGARRARAQLVSSTAR